MTLQETAAQNSITICITLDCKQEVRQIAAHHYRLTSTTTYCALLEDTQDLSELKPGLDQSKKSGAAKGMSRLCTMPDICCIGHYAAQNVDAQSLSGVLWSVRVTRKDVI